MADRRGLEQVGGDLVEQRLEGVVVVLCRRARRRRRRPSAFARRRCRRTLRRGSRRAVAPPHGQTAAGNAAQPRTDRMKGPQVPVVREALAPANPQHLGDRPGLERAAGRGVRRGAVGRLRDRAEAPLAEVRLEPVEQPVDRRRRRARAASTYGPEQPGPDGALVVGRVALGRAAAVVRAGSAGRRGDERAQPERRQQRVAAGGDDRAAGRPRRRAGRRAARRRAAGSAAPRRRRRRARRRRRSRPRRRAARSARRTTPRACVARAPTSVDAVASGASRRATSSAAEPERVHLDRLAGARRDRQRRRCGRPSRSAPSRPRPAAAARRPGRRRCRSACRRGGAATIASSTGAELGGRGRRRR